MNVTDTPELVFAISIVALWLCAWLGAVLPERQAGRQHDSREDFNLVLTGSLTLLGLIIGFTFSMAVSRYDLRKSDEATEANAIGTEYVRLDLLPAADAAKLRPLIRSYLEQRILFYNVRDPQRLAQINAQTTNLQGQLWSLARSSAAAEPNAVVALAVSGMNDVLNSQSYTQAAWVNRIPREAWELMALIAMLCNVMIGYAASRLKGSAVFLALMPLVVSIAFFLIADIDSPRGGLIHVKPQNLLSLASALPQP